jgi:superfamily II DNA or RNA helicase
VGSYESYIERKTRSVDRVGIDVFEISGVLFPWQAELVDRALRRGRFALFTDTGTGKTLMQLEWARHVAREGRVLVLAPLAVAEQTVAEGGLLGMDLRYLRRDDGSQIVVTNYEMLSHFDPSAFVGVVLDESSILKSFTGRTRTAIIDAFVDTPYRLACTATPAPNDHMELGNHAEFLGEKSRTEMLAEYFVHDGSSTQAWRIKGHAQDIFWRWVCSWGAFMGHPSELGYSDDDYVLPELRMHEHIIDVDHVAAQSSGMLFAMQARTLNEQRAVRRGTISARVEKAAALVNGSDHAIVWCELNAESDALKRAIDGAVEIKGSDDPDSKHRALTSFSRGDTRVVVTKPSIAGFGLNWQHCNRVVFVGASHSFEQTYQAIRRCWRFGQERPVDVHIIRAETEDAIVANYRRKEAQFATMRTKMVEHTRHALEGARWVEYSPRKEMEIPPWLTV